MKNIIKHLFILCLSFSYLSSFGQITITENDLIDENESYIMTIATPGIGFDPSTTGPNYNWDFSSNLTAITLDTINTVSVISTPIAYQLYFNNIFLYPDHYSNYALTANDIGSFTQMQLTERYEYFKKNSTGLKIVGYGAKVNGIPTSVKYDTIDQILPLPLDYGTNDSTTAYYLFSVPNLGTYGQWIRRKVEVDGWGTIKTPSGSYNALRVKTTLYQRDTMYFDQLNFGNEIDRSVEYLYEWFANNEKVPVFSAKVVNMIPNDVKYKGTASSSITKLKFGKTFIYPNPARNEVIINTEGKQFEKIELYNYQGDLIQSKPFSQLLNIKDYPAGIYLLKLIDNKSSTTTTFIKN